MEGYNKDERYEDIIKKLIYYNLKAKQSEDGTQWYYKCEYEFPLLRTVKDEDIIAGNIRYKDIIDDMFRTMMVITNES